jgi:MYXO-CTERM domain-containing protein
VVRVRLRVSWAAALALLLSGHSASAIPVAQPQCGWVVAEDFIAFESDVPREGTLLLPVGLRGWETLPDPFAALPITVEVLDADGNVVEGSLELSSLAGTYLPPEQAALLFRATLPFEAGGHYTARVISTNSVTAPSSCTASEPPLDELLEFDVAVESLSERLANELLVPWEFAFRWIQTDSNPCVGPRKHYCEARSTDLCEDGAPCQLCLLATRSLALVLSREASPPSPYLVTLAFSRPSAEMSEATGGFVFLDSDEHILHVPYCQQQYCVSIGARALSGEQVESEPVCMPGEPPLVQPPAEGPFLYAGDPCADGRVHQAEPPECTGYPLVEWYTPPPDVDAGAPDAGPLDAGPLDAGGGPPFDEADDTVGRRTLDGCACRTAPGAAPPALGLLPVALLVTLLRTARRHRPARRPVGG